jgi:iron complex transport system substrate-binding protein
MLLVSPALASDAGTLEIYGNANEDDTIDMRDLTYVKLIFFGKKPETELADAKYDGKINPLDFIQIKLIIVGKEKELTIVDSADRIVTVKKPVERVVVACEGPHEPMILIGKNKIVGLSDEIKEWYPDIVEKSGLMGLPSVGPAILGELDYEKIISLEPDLVLVSYWVEAVSEKLPEEIPVVALGFDQSGPEIIVIPELQKLGAILEEEEEEKANEIINWIQKYEGIIEDRTEGLTLEEKTTYYIETYADYVTYGSNAYDGLVAAGCGGRNIVDEASIPAGIWGDFEVSPEWVLLQDPDVIFSRLSGGFSGFEWTNEEAETRLNELIDRPGWKKLSAVKEDRVHLYAGTLVYTPRYIIGRCYFAKWLQPDLFNDLDPESMHKEYWKEFLGIDLEGVWAYPPLK